MIFECICSIPVLRNIGIIMCFVYFQAHQQGRKADMLLKSGKYEEAITCHNRAAGFIIVHFIKLELLFILS